MACTLQQSILTYGKDVTMSSRTPSTEVLVRRKYVEVSAAGQALYTLEQFTITEGKIYSDTSHTHVEEHRTKRTL